MDGKLNLQVLSHETSRDRLTGNRIVFFDTTLVVAETKYRGDLEKKLANCFILIERNNRDYSNPENERLPKQADNFVRRSSRYVGLSSEILILTFLII